MPGAYAQTEPDYTNWSNANSYSSSSVWHLIMHWCAASPSSNADERCYFCELLLLRRPAAFGRDILSLTCWFVKCTSVIVKLRVTEGLLNGRRSVVLTITGQASQQGENSIGKIILDFFSWNRSCWEASLWIFSPCTVKTVRLASVCWTGVLHYEGYSRTGKP